LGTPAQTSPVTNDELIKHRLHELEEFATGWREAERRVDTLVMSVAAVEKTVSKIEQVLETNAKSMARLHERLDDALKQQAAAEARELGRSEARTKTWKVVAWTIMACISFGLFAVALLNLVTN
jgi:septal ring factor EnvC (AmiA/AmiB activator)